MWNTSNWMDKAKHMAANIDKQLNESVGVEADTTASTTEVSNEEESSMSAAVMANNQEENVWNDDFGFDDEEEVVQQPPTIPSPVVSMPVTPSQPPPGPVGATPASNQGWDQDDGNDNDGPLFEDEEEEVVDMQQEASFSSPESKNNAPQALWGASSMLSSLATKAAPQVSSLSSFATNALKLPTPATTATPATTTQSSSTEFMEPEEPTPEPEPTPAEAGWDEGDDLDSPDIDDMDDADVVVVVEEPTEQSPITVPVPTTPKPEPPTPAAAPEAPPTEEVPPAAPVVVVVAPPNEEPVPPLAAVQERPAPAPVVLTPEPVSHAVEAPKRADDTQSIVVVAPAVGTTISDDDDQRLYQQLKQELTLREAQLASKSEQLTQLQSLWETQEQGLRQKIHETKEEAKKRILKAKERCEIAETKLKQQQSSGAESSGQQDHLIAALRTEGENLAKKQSKLEQAVRSAKNEVFALGDKLEDETKAKTQALEKSAKLEIELKATKESLSSARKGESQAGKMEDDLLAARSDAEQKAATILTLQQQIKELSADGKELRDEIEKTRKLAAQDAHQEKKTLRREHNDVISDLETKLRTTEREAGVREDALRHEVSELRKRWQDAVRRADALSMDVQSSTAPLLRQLESFERQSRARAAAWAELETRLRSELEETVIQNETLSKERSEFKTKYTRLERSVNEREADLKQSKRGLEEQTATITKLEAQLVELKSEAEKRQEEYSKVERLANEGVMRVRSEMTQTVVDSEDRYRGQIDKLETEVRVEKEKRSQLEKQVDGLLENAGIYMAPQAPETFRRESKPQKLRKGEGQAEILAGALGLDSDEDEEEVDDILGISMDRGSTDGDDTGSMHTSFAALEQLSSRLKVAQIELEALRKNLRESERTRESLVVELGESRHAKEKLPLFEAKVKELTEDNREKELEIRGLRDDIFDVRELYRTQLNILLEEKAALAESSLNNGGPAPSSTSNSGAPKPEATAEPVHPEEEAEPSETTQPENQ